MVNLSVKLHCFEATYQFILIQWSLTEITLNGIQDLVVYNYNKVIPLDGCYPQTILRSCTYCYAPEWESKWGLTSNSAHGSQFVYFQILIGEELTSIWNPSPVKIICTGKGYNKTRISILFFHKVMKPQLHMPYSCQTVKIQKNCGQHLRRQKSCIQQRTAQITTSLNSLNTFTQKHCMDKGISCT